MTSAPAGPRRAGHLLRAHGIVVTVLFAAAAEFATRSGVDVQAPAPLLLAVLYASFVGGALPGAVSCLLATAYVAYALAPAGDVGAMTGTPLARLIGFAVVAPLTVATVAVLKRRSERRLVATAEAMRLEKQQYEHVFETLDKLGLGVVLVDAESQRFLQVNDSICRLTGYSRTELLEMPSFFSLVPPEEVAERRARLRSATSGGAEPARREVVTLLRKDGAIVRAEVGARIVAHGPVELLALVRDVEDQAALAERLSRSEALLCEAERIANFGAWEWDVLAGRLQWSEGMYRLYGYEPGTRMTFDRAMERMHPDDEPLSMARLADLRARAKAQPGAELRVEDSSYRVILPTGEVRRLLASYVARSDAQGELVRLMGTVRLVASAPPEAPGQRARRSRREATLREP